MNININSDRSSVSISISCGKHRKLRTAKIIPPLEASSLRNDGESCILFKLLNNS